MAPKKNSRSHAKKEAKPVMVNKAEKTPRVPGSSIFTWFMVVALLGVWSSVAVVWFDLVDYEDVVARAKEFRFNVSEVLQGRLGAYDADGDGDFDVEDAKVLLGLKEASATDVTKEAYEDPDRRNAVIEELGLEDKEFIKVEGNQHEKMGVSEALEDVERDSMSAIWVEPDAQAESNQHLAYDPFNVLAESVSLVKMGLHSYETSKEGIDTEGVIVEEALPKETEEDSEEQDSGLSSFGQKDGAELKSESVKEPEFQSVAKSKSDSVTEGEGAATESHLHRDMAVVKKKKPKLLNKFDRSIKAEIGVAEMLRKKGKVEEAVRQFEMLVQKYPQSPRCHFGRAQAEDDLAEKMRSNDLLQKAISSYREASEVPNAPADLIKVSLKRRAERQQFLGRMRGALATLEKLVELFPADMAVKNDLGVAHLLIGDNKSAKKVFEEVLAVAPNDGFAKVHYGFILKSENKIEESIPFLRDGLESGAPGTDDGRFYFHLGDALQRMGDDTAYQWYEAGHQRGHFASVWQRSLYNVDGLRAQPWWTPKETGYTDLIKTLERNWKMIREEALSVMDAASGLFTPEEENLREKGEWGQFTLWQQGKKVGDSCRSVPKTCALLEHYPEATSCKRGQIKFSVMHPGTHVWPHTGPTNCRLRMHLGLVIPPQGCKIRCTNETRMWQEGKVLIFDDSFEHEVWQDANSYRLIFIVDVWHPQLTHNQRQTLSPI